MAFEVTSLKEWGFLSNDTVSYEARSLEKEKAPICIGFVSV